MKKLHLTLSTVALALASSTASANIITLFETQFDTDWTVAGVGGLRGTGASTIDLTGVSGTVNQAYLYWHGPTTSSDPAFNANISFDGNAVSGTNIGFSADNNWGQTNSQAYRADVTSLVSGNGMFSISGLSANNSNGASLVVFYDDGDTTNNRDVVTYDGNDSNITNSFDPFGWDITLAGINYTSGTASLLFGVSDGQSFLDDAIVVNGTTVIPDGPIFQGLSVPNTAGTSVGNGALWDLVNVDVTAQLSPGMNTLNVTTGTNGDALSAIHIHVDLPAGAAPPVDPPISAVPEPGSLSLLGLALLGLTAMRRRLTARA